MGMSGELPGWKMSMGMSGNCLGGKCPKEKYPYARAEVMICATLVNTQTHTDKQLLTGGTIRSADYD